MISGYMYITFLYITFLNKVIRQCKYHFKSSCTSVLPEKR